jgi:hypothetical protein
MLDMILYEMRMINLKKNNTSNENKLVEELWAKGKDKDKDKDNENEGISLDLLKLLISAILDVQIYPNSLISESEAEGIHRKFHELQVNRMISQGKPLKVPTDDTASKPKARCKTRQKERK